MKFSTKAEYGLRAVLHLVKSEAPVSLKQIAKIEKLSLPYLERIFSRLKKAGLVVSRKGMRGGYCLRQPASVITAAEVIIALEGELYHLKCPNCDIQDCRVHPVWEKLYEQIKKTLESITLQSLIK